MFVTWFRLFYRHKIWKNKLFNNIKIFFYQGLTAAGQQLSGAMHELAEWLWLAKNKQKKKQLPLPENRREKNTYNSVNLVTLKRKEQCYRSVQPVSHTYIFLDHVSLLLSSGIFFASNEHLCLNQWDGPESALSLSVWMCCQLLGHRAGYIIDI